jgi:5-methylcytosine-specific restriction endonuclease McrA
MATLEVDHVIAVARGGSNAPANLLASCRPCNQLKTDHIVAFSIKTRRPHFIPW